MANKIIQQLFGIIITIQILCILVFLTKEYTHLDKIRYYYKLTDTITIDMTINFYVILTVIAVIFVIVIIASISILGSGLGDVGGRSILRLVSFIVIFIILTIGVSYYFQSLGGVFLGIWTVISSFVYITYLASENIETPV